jgi:hypothetical protein
MAEAALLRELGFRATLVALILVVHLVVAVALVELVATRRHLVDMLDQAESGYKVL